MQQTPKRIRLIAQQGLETSTWIKITFVDPLDVRNKRIEKIVWELHENKELVFR